ncbi:MAG: DUF1559 domain-containing protein [Thermoguttaceae bacterium]|jgi:prepilin-type N-terminal cleavage/methylation domain-containing protein/prepilin-type processing-associated H-X9-DG protein
MARQYRSKIGRSKIGRGFSLVELLVVITIIGILAGLLLPAVQSTREAARRAQCENNLKQFAAGAMQHESLTGFYPSGGWGWFSIGDPDRGYGATQPGGWLYNLLPFIEEMPLHDLGVNIAYNVSSSSDPGTQQRIQFAITMVQTPLKIANCPSRRRPGLYKKPSNGTFVANNYGGVSNPANNNVVARTDYAACCGVNGGTEIDGGAADPGWTFPPSPASPYPNVTCPYDVAGLFNSWTGVTFRCSQIGTAQIKGGTGNTILYGDKYDCATVYSNGGSASENENQYVGMDNDISRSTCSLPMHDRDQVNSATMFGGCHPACINFAFCDGSVRSLNYNIDFPTYQQLGRRVKTAQVDESLVK